MYWKILNDEIEVYSVKDKEFWTDDHISKGMLEAHLDSTSDAATRNIEIVNKTVNFISQKLASNKHNKIIDFGCGPGIYCREFAKLNFEVTGVDFSKRSIEYAEKANENERVNVSYIYKNYLEFQSEDQFDAAMMIYYDFDVLSHDERIILLKNIRNSLKENGLFIFDVMTVKEFESTENDRNWNINEIGFFSPIPHIELFERVKYYKDNTILDRYIIIEDNSNIKDLRIWHHYFTIEEIKELLNKNGFEVIEIYENLMGTPFSNNSSSAGIIAKKVSNSSLLTPL